MVHHSTITGHFNQLKKDICDLETNFEAKLINNISCGSDCYCGKQKNHKVTNSVYHKNCISMKKSAYVKKCDLIQPRNKSTERKEIFHLDKAQVEISLKSGGKDIKCTRSGGLLKHDGRKEKHHPKLVDTGSDPIMILEPKKPPMKCWSTILSENSKAGNPEIQPSAPKAPFEPPVKLKSCSTTSSFPDNSSPSSRSVERASHRSKQSVIVRDRAIQCQQAEETTKNNLFSYDNPVNSLQTLVKDLKSFKKQLNDKTVANSLNPIISEMDFALTRLLQPNPNTASINAPSQCSNDARSESPTQILKKTTALSGPKVAYKGLEKTLEETCYQLQVSCLKLEETCQKLRKEKDNITEQFFEKSRELEKCLKRELEYQAKLNEANQSADAMSQKLDQYTKSMEELSKHVKKLQAENKALERVEQAKSSLVNQLLEASRENEQLNSQIQLMTLEREKNRVLLDIKEQEVAKLKAELRSIGGLVSEKMLETAMGGDSLMVTSRFEVSESREVAFSSPDGSMSSPSKSWKALSSIMSPSQHRKLLPPPLTLESKGTSDMKPRKHPLDSINHLKNELRELFAQMKQQTELSESVIPEIPTQGDDTSPWSNITDSSDGYNSITENELSEVT